MASDLTERLAAKLMEKFSIRFAEQVSLVPGDLLPLLLSEPELVAGLAPEAKREVLAVLLKERCAELTPDDWRQLADSAGVKSYWSIYNDLFDVSETVVGVFAPEVPRG